MTEQERIAMEMAMERRQGQQPKPVSGGLERITGLDATFIDRLRVLPNQIAVRLRSAEAELVNARRYGNVEDQARAERQLKRAKEAAGLGE